MRQRNLTEERIFSENEVTIIDLNYHKISLEPKLQDAKKLFDKTREDIRNYLPTWIVAQVEFVVAFMFFDQFPWQVQTTFVVIEAVVSGILIYDMQKYFRKKRIFEQTKANLKQVKEKINSCKEKLTQEEKVYLVFEEGINLSE